MMSNIYTTWAYDWSDDPLANFFMGTAPVGGALVAMFDSTSKYSALASTSYKEVVDWTAKGRNGTSDCCSRLAKTVRRRMGSLAPAHTSLTEGD